MVPPASSPRLVLSGGLAPAVVYGPEGTCGVNPVAETSCGAATLAYPRAGWAVGRFKYPKVNASAAGCAGHGSLHLFKVATTSQNPFK